jgi:hypothetical protein
VQVIAAYVAFLLVLVAFGLSIICVGVLSIVLCEGANWAWSRFYSRALHDSSVFGHH